jgi:integrase/recombinase XerD
MTTKDQETKVKFAQDTYLPTLLDAFYVDRKAQGMTPGTIKFYHETLKQFLFYCDSQAITQVDQLTPVIVREFLLWLETNGHNPGGIHVYYRALKAFLNWYENEFEPDDWRNPIRKVPAPKLPQKILEPVELDTVSKLLDCIGKGTLNAERDRALLLALLDTGCRARELLSIDLADVNHITGEVIIRQGKGRKDRTVFLSKKTRKAVRTYLKYRRDAEPALFVTDELDRLQYDGLRQIVRRLSDKAGIIPPSLHSFRRAFALNALRAGMDVYSLQRLMGHADLQVLRRYLNQTDADLQEAHTKFSPVDRL